MKFQEPLITGSLIKRYKRFLADVKLSDDSTLTVYCPNTGSMRSCSTPGSQVALSISDNTKRKYPHTLEMIQEGATWVGVNTGRTNNLVVEAIRDMSIDELTQYNSIKQEVKTSKGTRLDILLTDGDQKIYIEVKNCSLVEDGVAMFPDALTTRGTKHLRELIKLVKNGHRGIIFYLVQRMDTDSFSPAAHIDTVYAETLKEAHDQGVEILVYQADVSLEGIQVFRPLPFSLTTSTKTE